MNGLTEQEAAGRWCPFARDFTDQDGKIATVNRGDPKMLDNRCIGSRCMAWRWIESEYEHTITVHERGYGPPRPPEGEGWELTEVGREGPEQWEHPGGAFRRKRARRTGLCGLAGPPSSAARARP